MLFNINLNLGNIILSLKYFDNTNSFKHLSNYFFLLLLFLYASYAPIKYCFFEIQI